MNAHNDGDDMDGEFTLNPVPFRASPLSFPQTEEVWHGG
jgi:hypothetical protein